MLYWGIFTVGFIGGVVLTLAIFQSVLFSHEAQEREESFNFETSLEEVRQLH